MKEPVSTRRRFLTTSASSVGATWLALHWPAILAAQNTPVMPLSRRNHWDSRSFLTTRRPKSKRSQPRSFPAMKLLAHARHARFLH